ncbi:hypothetical protein SISNIDRAFT_488639 [Sistotremastrum niveocremeum HHB9708]|uniref:Uncharacterized protein n=1 Tax=Sistotremastrum niveocremeum HHB9708 TaxID=1314777 RepID=A0A164QZF2_9AGAM|nr:hypothetical protein SISNIDRAFT_488639 [Sistotremastrum niveocremeum HHB9708]
MSSQSPTSPPQKQKSTQPPNRRPQTAQNPTIHQYHQTLHQSSISTRVSPPSPPLHTPTPALLALRSEPSLKPARYHQTVGPNQNEDFEVQDKEDTGGSDKANIVKPHPHERLT